MSDNDKKTNDYIIDAYEKMLERVHDLVDKAEHASVPKLRDALDEAKDKAVTLGEVTREEAEKVSKYVERDLHDAAEFLVDTGEELQDWLRFDLQMVEERFFEWFAKAADQTSIQLQELAERARQDTLYQVDDVVGPGTLICTHCGKAYRHTRPGRVLACSLCGNRTFQRRAASSVEPDENIDQGEVDGG